MPIATGVAYFGSCRGGEFAFYPDGPEGAPRTLPVKHDTAVLLDTDRVFHGVDRVHEAQPIPAIRPGTELVFEADAGRWRAVADGRTLASYGPDEVRFSVSWKAYCYADERERRLAERHEDDLQLADVLATLEADLRARGALEGPRPPDREFALLLIGHLRAVPGSLPSAA